MRVGATAGAGGGSVAAGASSSTLEISEADFSSAKVLHRLTVESIGGVELRRTPSVKGIVGV